MSSPQPRFVSVAGAAKFLGGGVSLWDVTELLDAGRIRSGFVAGRRLVDFNSLREFAGALTQEAR